MNGNILRIDGKNRADGIRARHRADVLKRVLENPGIDRTSLAAATGLTNAAMTRIVQELEAAGLVKDAGTLEQHGGRGRKRSGLQINAEGGYVLGLSILAFNSSVVLCDISGKVVDLVPVKPVDIYNPASTLDDVSHAALKLLKKHKLSSNEVIGAGAAIAGYLDKDGDILKSSPYLGWPVFDIRQSLSKRLNLRLVVENANRCLAVAETRTGSCTGVEDLILIRAAMGVGGAIVNNGTITRGNDNQAGHIGHLCVKPGGLLCSCGAKGCLNTVASGWAILKQLGFVTEESVDAQDMVSLEARLRQVLSDEQQSNKQYQSAIRNAGGQLARHCAGLIHSMAPHTLVLAGPLGRSASYCQGFTNTLKKYQVNVPVSTAYEQNICGTAEAAAVFSLAHHVYSPSLDIQPLLADAAAVSQGGVL